MLAACGFAQRRKRRRRAVEWKQRKDSPMWLFDNRAVPDLRTPLPGPRAQQLLRRDQQHVSPSYTRIYPLVVERGSGCVIEDVDGNLFLDFTAGIAVTA